MSLELNGLAYRSTNLESGMIVHQINGVNVLKLSPAHATAIIRCARGEVTLVVEKRSERVGGNKRYSNTALKVPEEKTARRRVGSFNFLKGNVYRR